MSDVNEFRGEKSQFLLCARYRFSINNLFKVLTDTMFGPLFQIRIICMQTDKYSHSEINNIRKKLECKHSCDYESDAIIHIEFDSNGIETKLHMYHLSIQKQTP